MQKEWHSFGSLPIVPHVCASGSHVMEQWRRLNCGQQTDESDSTCSWAATMFVTDVRVQHDARSAHSLHCVDSRSRDTRGSCSACTNGSLSEQPGGGISGGGGGLVGGAGGAAMVTPQLLALPAVRRRLLAPKSVASWACSSWWQQPMHMCMYMHMSHVHVACMIPKA